MKITHVLTYVSEDGAFGGPTSVAVAQLNDLAELGISAGLVAGWDGKATLSHAGSQSLTRAWKFGKGFRVIVAPKLLWEMIRSRPADEVFHIHLGRDPVSMAAAFIAKVRRLPFVVQTHGMISPKTSPAMRLFDFIFTAPVLRAARMVYVLTEDERRGIIKVADGRANLSSLPNGIKAAYPSKDTERDPELIIFLARLHPRKRVLAFVSMCRHLRDKGLKFRAEVYGPDEGDLAEMEREIVAANLTSAVKYCGSVPPGRSMTILPRAGLFVLPSFGEIFPMTVLEALASRTPVVTTADSGIAPILEDLDAALVTDGSPVELAAAAASIISNASRRDELIHNGEKAITEHFGIRAVTRQLVEQYRLILG